MPDATYQPPSDFMTMQQAAAEIGITVVTLRRLIQRRGIQVYEDARDARARLLRVADVEALKRPIPIMDVKTAA